MHKWKVKDSHTSSLYCFSFQIELFYENGALEALTGLSVDESCPDFQHALETVMTLASANENALMALAEREPALIERFEAKLNERRQLIQGSEDDLVRFLDRQWGINVFLFDF